jgi:hypothetical protein
LEGAVSEQAGLSGELVYEYALQVTRVAEYGISADALFSGQLPPPEGARLDLHLDGTLTGPRFAGTVKGVDYLYFRPDGRAELHIHAEITTQAGRTIALAAGGVAIRQEASSVFQLRENVSLMTHYAEHSWVNQIQIWAQGTVDVSDGDVRVKGYAV